MRWPIYDHVIFDFDSTLTEIEGIDVLAAKAGVGEEVSELTSQAMDGKVELSSVYEKRLTTIDPTRGSIRALKEEYRKHITEDAESVIAALFHLGHQVYIVSGGLLDPIIEIGSTLGIPKDNIKAVDVEYDEFSGEWWLAQTDEYNRHQRFLKSNDTELEKTHGKAAVIRALLAGKRGRSLLIGDGTSDLAASVTVDLFVGFTGVVERALVLDKAPVIVRSKSLAPVIVIAAGPRIEEKLHNTRYQALCEKAFELVDEHMLHFNDTDLESLFQAAYRQTRGDTKTIF
ncbi:MAG: HAD-IB family phosphatase [Arenicellales bacterium]|nr:HAD-IB family phosphatase [Arenicellales bacterium]